MSLSGRRFEESNDARRRPLRLLQKKTVPCFVPDLLLHALGKGLRGTGLPLQALRKVPFPSRQRRLHRHRLVLFAPHDESREVGHAADIAGLLIDPIQRKVQRGLEECVEGVGVVLQLVPLHLHHLLKIFALLHNKILLPCALLARPQHPLDQSVHARQCAKRPNRARVHETCWGQQHEFRRMNRWMRIQVQCSQCTTHAVCDDVFGLLLELELRQELVQLIHVTSTTVVHVVHCGF
mmetsp:Transcript_28889/g.68461  ORF Transcript_28889/g.68461 Transcript_28889/m.68461 type:complete len:237 (-) Transcript_28889:292-1002(-)